MFLKWEVQESGVIIRLHPGGLSHKVQACKIQIEQVVINLLQNSLEAIRDGNISEWQSKHKITLINE